MKSDELRVKKIPHLGVHCWSQKRGQISIHPVQSRHRSVLFVIHGVTGVMYSVCGKHRECAGAYLSRIQAVV
jgi:hypothetical protein